MPLSQEPVDEVIRIYSPEDAWDAFESQNYDLARHIWFALLPTATDISTLAAYQHGYAIVLLAQRKFSETLAMLEELYDTTQDSLCLYQLGHVALAQGQLDMARAHFVAEQACLQPGLFLPAALNAYAMGRIALAQAKIPVAFHYARHSCDQARKASDGMTQAFAWHLMSDVRLAKHEDEKAQDCLKYAQAAWAAAPVQSVRETGELRFAALLLNSTVLKALRTRIASPSP